MHHLFQRHQKSSTEGKGRVSKPLFALAFAFAVTNAAWVGYFMYTRSTDAAREYKNPYPLIDPARSIVGQEHFFSTIEPLRKEMKAIVARYAQEGNRIGLYYEYLNTGANVSINQDARFWPASLSKMPTVFAVMKKIEKGEWKLSNELVLFSEDKDDRFGSLHGNPSGTRFTIETLLKETLINSDNTAHRMLVRNLSSEDFTDIFEALGMEELFDEQYDITAKEYSRIFRALYNASYLNRADSQQILLWLSQTPFKEFIRSGVPPDIVVSHKIGEEHKEVVFLDSGIVYASNRPYLLTVMVEVENGGGITLANEIMKNISEAAYAFAEQN